MKSPEMLDVYKLLCERSDDWDDFARGLFINFNFRKELNLEHSTTCGSKLERVLAKWIESKSSDVTWSNLIDVLVELKFSTIVTHVQRYLQTEDVIKKYSRKEDYKG